MWCIKVVSTFPTHIRMLKKALSKPFDGTHLVKKNTWQVTWVRDTNSQWHIGERKDYRLTSPRECLGTPPTRCDIRRKWHHAQHFDSVSSPVLSEPWAYWEAHLFTFFSSCVTLAGSSTLTLTMVTVICSLPPLICISTWVLTSIITTTTKQL